MGNKDGKVIIVALINHMKEDLFLFVANSNKKKSYTAQIIA